MPVNQSKSSISCTFYAQQYGNGHWEIIEPKTGFLGFVTLEENQRKIEFSADANGSFVTMDGVEKEVDLKKKSGLSYSSLKLAKENNLTDGYILDKLLGRFPENSVLNTEFNNAPYKITYDTKSRSSSVSSGLTDKESTSSSDLDDVQGVSSSNPLYTPTNTDTNESAKIANIYQAVSGQRSNDDPHQYKVKYKDSKKVEHNMPLDAFLNYGNLKKLGDINDVAIMASDSANEGQDHEVAIMNILSEGYGVKTHKIEIQSMVTQGNEANKVMIELETRNTIGLTNGKGKIATLGDKLNQKKGAGIRKAVSDTITLEKGVDFNYGGKGDTEIENNNKKGSIDKIRITYEDGGYISEVRRNLGRNDSRDRCRFIIQFDDKEPFVVSGRDFDEAKERCICSIQNTTATQVKLDVSNMYRETTNKQSVTSHIDQAKNTTNSSQMTHVTSDKNDPPKPK